MLAYLLRRCLLIIPTLLGVLLLTFVVLQFVPGGPVEQYLMEAKSGSVAGVRGGAGTGAEGSSIYQGQRGVDPERLAQIQALYGFDQPAPARFAKMLGQFARFDLGQSFFHHQPVSALIAAKLPVSITLGMWTFFLSYLISIPLGILKALKAGSRFDAASTAVVLVGVAIPSFVMGVLLLVVFAGQLQWFPLRGLTSANFADLSLWGKVKDYLWHITLPVSASILGSFAFTTLLTKNSFLEEISKQYVRTARAKGLSERRIAWRHVLRNAMIPIVVGFPSAFIAAFFADALLIETLFSLDGLGLLSYESVIRRDYPVVMGTLFLFTLIGLVMNIVSDMAYVWVDPRVRLA